jgi:hypothetical protein
MLTGALVPAPEKGEPPEPSIAILPGLFSPLPAKTEPLVPVEVSLVTVLLPEFATQAFPEVSTAMAERIFNAAGGSCLIGYQCDCTDSGNCDDIARETGRSAAAYVGNSTGRVRGC